MHALDTPPRHLPAAILDAGGGQLSLSPMPVQTRLGDDLTDLRDAGAAVLLSLVGDDEFGPGGPDAFGARVAAAGLDWLRLPIADYGVPQDAAAVLDDALSRLGQGQHVAIHCRAGCGRSGMIALRLMVLAGEEPEHALDRLRLRRPCAVETEAQRLWASRPARD